MKKIVTVVGARPQFIKAAAISRAFKESWEGVIEEILVHTGQHYDDNMSDIFFKELGLPRPAYNLGVGSGAHGKQTAAMIEGIEKILLETDPAAVILYGDTNSTLAGSVAASKLKTPVIHIEAGLRSFNKSMPEEINRIVCDHCSTLLFSPTPTGFNNLIKEGFDPNTKPPFNIDHPGIFHCGDVMYDNCLYYSARAEIDSMILDTLDLEPESFLLATIHRDNNTAHTATLSGIFDAFEQIAKAAKMPVVIPLHPRTLKVLNKDSENTSKWLQSNGPNVRIIEPVSYFDMLVLEKNCSMVFTDSGGVQKEAYFFRKPCIILRNETEWTEIVDTGSARIAGTAPEDIISAWRRLSDSPPLQFPAIFGQGDAAQYICKEINQLIDCKG